MKMKMKSPAAASLALVLCCSMNANAQSTEGKVRANGLGLISADGENSINLTGRLHFDNRMINSQFASDANTDKDTSKYGDTLDIRRARIGINGTLMRDISYEVVFNAASSDSTNLDTGWVNYAFAKPLNLRVGKFKQQFNLEELTSSNNIDFIERSFVNQFAPGKKVGMMVHGVLTDGLSYGISSFQDATAVISASGARQSTVRVAANFAELAGMPGRVFHLGVARHSGTVDIASGATGEVIKLRTDARGADGIFASTFASGDTNNVNQVKRSSDGLEMAIALGALKLQTETAKSNFDFANTARTNVVDGTIKSQYMAVVYNLTGEKWSDAYKDGVFGAVRPTSNFSSKGKGTGGWQLSYRTSSYDATDWTSTTATTGSKKGKTDTLGINWLLNPNARIMLNHSTTKFDTPFALGASTGNKEVVTTLRTQVNF
jgi:phosphate-selective porin OprO/OprP